MAARDVVVSSSWWKGPCPSCNSSPELASVIFLTDLGFAASNGAAAMQLQAP
jgi:hypothetical protein